MHLRNVIPILIAVLSSFYAVDSFAALSFSGLTITPAAFSPLSNSASTTTAASYLLSDASTVTVTISGPLPGSSVVRTILDEIVYCDDFSDGSFAGWSVVALDTWSIKTDGGRPNVLAFNYHDSGGAGRIVYGGAAWSDYAVEADVKLVCGNRAGIIFRASDINPDLNDPNNYYQFFIDDSGQVRLERINSTTPDPSPGSYTMTISRNTWYHLKVAATGSTVRCYVNGSMKILMDSMNVSSGRVGLMTQTTSLVQVESAYFDNFSVYKLSQIWNGKKDNGDNVTAGIYTIKLSAKDLAGNTAETFGTVLVDAPPAVKVVNPGLTTTVIGGLYSPTDPTGYCVNWTVSDPDVDPSTHTFEIWLGTPNASIPSGTSFFILVASGAPDGVTLGTTFYQMETLRFEDKEGYRIKVVATDSFGLSGVGISTSNAGAPWNFMFSIFNFDFQPVVTVISPDPLANPNDWWSGYRTIAWSVSHKNTWDIQDISYNIYISTVGLVYGCTSHEYFDSLYDSVSQSWQLIKAEVKGTSYQYGTGMYPDSKYSAIRITALSPQNDWRQNNPGGDPTGWGTGVSNSTFTVYNKGNPPNAFSLLSPPKGGSINSFRPAFSWTATTDPDAGDSVKFYELWYSTAIDFAVYSTTTTISNTWTPDFNLQNGKRYYWKVWASDLSGKRRESTETDWYFDINRSAKTSDDGKVTVTINGTLPFADSYVYIGTVTISQTPALSAANQKLTANSSVRSITDTAYEIKIMQNNVVLTTYTISAAISIDCPYGVDSSGYIDYLGFPASYLKIVRFDEIENKWVLAAQEQTLTLNAALRKATVSVQVNSFSTYGIIAYAAPDTALFDVGNFPNPFNPNNEKTTINFGLTKDSKVTINIFNLIGDLVWEKTIASPVYDSSGMTKHRELWDGKNGDGMIVATGMYICRITAEPKDGSAKIIKLRKIGVNNK